jgi:hypothetical protein
VDVKVLEPEAMVAVIGHVVSVSYVTTVVVDSWGTEVTLGAGATVVCEGAPLGFCVLVNAEVEVIVMVETVL